MIKTGAIACFMMIIFVSCNTGNADEAVVNYDYAIEDSMDYSPAGEQQQAKYWPASFGFGKKASDEKIRAWDIDVRPDGKGLPAGKGTVQTGKAIYAVKCISCHGPAGEGGSGGRLLGIKGDTTKAKAIGNYWPYSSTLFDYIRRAMPFNAPGSLNDEEVYSLSAYLLYINKLIDSAAVMNRATLPRVKMPAQPFFVVDDRRGGPGVR